MEEQRIAALQIQLSAHERQLGELEGQIRAVPELILSVERLTAAMNRAEGMFRVLQLMGAMAATGAAFAGYIFGKH